MMGQGHPGFCAGWSSHPGYLLAADRAGSTVQDEIGFVHGSFSCWLCVCRCVMLTTGGPSLALVRFRSWRVLDQPLAEFWPLVRDVRQPLGIGACSLFG